VFEIEISVSVIVIDVGTLFSSKGVRRSILDSSIVIEENEPPITFSNGALAILKPDSISMFLMLKKESRIRILDLGPRM
jgi:hypothetical protein